MLLVIGAGVVGYCGGRATDGPLQVAIMALLRSSFNGMTSPAAGSYVKVLASITKLWQSGSSIHLALTPDPACDAVLAVV